MAVDPKAKRGGSPPRSSDDDLIAAAQRQERRPAAADRAKPILPERVGRYKITRYLGEGGMGIVYEAEQAVPSRHVALKVLKTGINAAFEDSRVFEREVDALARLQHPAIGTIYEAGQTEDGRPFFAMELIRGLNLREYASLVEPSQTERLAILARICDAVAHAHQHGVIHRDLKPENILVDDDGNPHVLDFGLAKIIDPHMKVTWSLVDGSKLVGSLPYMSPEQSSRTCAEIDFRADVYSLGITLYEFLTGRFPFRVNVEVAEILRQIAETIPAPPSKMRPDGHGILSRGRWSWRRKESAINQDIDTIVLKAIAKERERRYQSAGELAGDIRRYLKKEPIEARRDSAWYVLRKTVWRFKAIVAVVLASYVVGITFGVAMVPMFRREQQRAERAERKLDTLLSAKIDIDPVDGLPTGRILTRTGEDLAWQPYLNLPYRVHAVEVVDLDGSGDQIVVLGSSVPVDGQTIAAFDRNATELWPLDLTPDWMWPGIEAQESWICNALTRAELDGRPGDELIVSSNAFGSFPSGLFIVDPRKGTVLHTFWHPGNIAQSRVLPNFFGRGKPAIVMCGTNNRLDEVDPKIPGARPYTNYDLVSFMAIVDPREIDGVGPPYFAGLAGIPPVKPYAYAFIDAAVSSTHDAAIPGDPLSRRRVAADEVAAIESFVVTRFPDKDGTGPVVLRLTCGRENVEPTVTIDVDRHLEFTQSIRLRDDAVADQFWKDRWRPILREGEFLSR